MTLLRNIVTGRRNNGYFSGKTKKIAIVSIILIILVSYGLFFYLQNTTENDIKNSLFEQQRRRQIESTEALSQNIGSNLDSIMVRLQMLANSPVLQQGQQSGNDTRKLLEEAYHQITDITLVDRIFILDKDNIVKINIVPKGEKTFIGANISYLDWVREATTEEKKPLFSNGYVGLDGKHRIAISYPIINRQTGEYMGLVGVVIPTEIFFAHYGNVHSINSQFLVVYDRKATLVAVGASKDLVGKNFFEEYTQNFINHNPTLNSLTRSLLTGKSGYAVYNYGRGERLTTESPIFVNGLPIYFVQVVTPTKEIYSQIDNTLFAQRIETFTLLAGTTAAIVALIIFLIKWSNTLQSEVKRRTRELDESNKQLSEANEQLKVHDKMQREFINIASHEMRTPTQAVLGFSDLLNQHPEKSEELCGTIHRNALRLKRLIDDVLDVTRIESQTFNLKKQKFDLDEVITTVIDGYRNQIQNNNNNNQKNLRFLYNTSGKNITVEADKERITQVISNLIDNAVKFTEEGTISVSVSAEEKEEEKGKAGDVMVTVKDTGSGISPDIYPRLFSKFASKSHKGTGLGLFISKSIVEAHGGKIWADNNSDGKGATFTFIINVNNKI